MDQHPPVETSTKEERGAVEAGRKGGRVRGRRAISEEGSVECSIRLIS
jgi:hypothetical protein